MDWSGKTVCCIASGPSLTAADCGLVESAGLPTIAVNSSWKLARFAAVIYAADPPWWDSYGKDIDIPAERWTMTENTASARSLQFQTRRAMSIKNSGLHAIELAISLGAARVLLLGYDCSVAAGTHWHGDHQQTKNPDALRCKAWLSQFAALDRKQAHIINCSRETALSCFPRMPLEQALCSFMECGASATTSTSGPLSASLAKSG